MATKLDDEILMNICPKCDLKYMCDNTPPHPYNNEIWHSCEHVKRIVGKILSTTNVNPYSLEHKCEKCNNQTLVKNGRWVQDTGQWICHSCYPKTKSYNKNDYY